MPMTAVAITFLNVLLLVLGQVLWKTGMIHHPFRTIANLPSLIMNPYVLLGSFVYTVATVVWLYGLSRYDLSRIYPLQSLAYVLGAAAGVYFFKETVSLRQWIGLALVVGGAALLAR